MENATDIGKLFKSELIFTWVLRQSKILECR